MVTPVNTATPTALNPIRVGRGPYQIEVTPNGKTAYVSTSSGVIPVNTSTRKAGQAIKGVFGSMFGAPVMARRTGRLSTASAPTAVR
jgi:DNA-binding beta-propeller fold protein YncE